MAGVMIVIDAPMIERAAQAIRDQTCNKSGRGKSWDKLPDVVHH